MFINIGLFNLTLTMGGPSLTLENSENLKNQWKDLENLRTNFGKPNKNFRNFEKYWYAPDNWVYIFFLLFLYT